VKSKAQDGAAPIQPPQPKGNRIMSKTIQDLLKILAKLTPDNRKLVLRRARRKLREQIKQNRQLPKK
jgi:hypothetical protein